MLHIFIDTNVLLSFYSFTQDDLTRLEQLAEQVEAGTFVILTTSHVEDEFRRNREGKIAESRERMATQRLDFRLPRLCDAYDETTELRNLAREYSRVHGELLERIDGDAESATLAADHLLGRFFDGATLLEVTGDLIAKARTRTELGNPPGKRGSIGDAVNWETLLDHAPEDRLIFVTDDKDFYSPLNDTQPREFLVAEWESVVGQPIEFVRRLSELPDPVPPEALPVDDVPNEVDNLIYSLQRSGNFGRTHDLVGELLRVPRFTAGQCRDLVAALDNSQVRWIINDPDVRSLYERVLATGRDDLPTHEAARVDGLFEPDDPEEAPF